MKQPSSFAELISKLRQPYHRPTKAINHKKNYKRQKRVSTEDVNVS